MSVMEKTIRSQCRPEALDLERMWHWGIEQFPKGGFKTGKGRFMVFLRQPEQRLLSWNTYRKVENRTQLTWLQMSGTAVKMLTRNTKSNEDYVEPSYDEVSEAKRRLRSGFAFVGITDQWALSICLFNAMFNQPCKPAQFDNARPTPNTSAIHNVSELNGHRDPYDNELYDVALDIFAK